MEPKTYDFEVQISTGQFEYINLKENGTPGEAVLALEELKRSWNKVGLPLDQFCTFITRQIRKGEESNHIDQMEQMSEWQKEIMQTIKKALKAGPLKEKKEEKREVGEGPGKHEGPEQHF